jgi:hypothetical protein
MNKGTVDIAKTIAKSQVSLFRLQSKFGTSNPTCSWHHLDSKEALKTSSRLLKRERDRQIAGTNEQGVVFLLS